MSAGLSNSYLLATDDGRIVVNTGMGFEGPLHRRAYDAVDRFHHRSDRAHPGAFRPRGGRRRRARRGDRRDRAGQLRHLARRQRTPRALPVAECRFRLDEGDRRGHRAREEAPAGRRGPVATRTDHHLRDSPRSHDRRTQARPPLDARRRDHRLARHLAPRLEDGPHRQSLRCALRPRAEPGDPERRPLPRRPRVRRVTRYRARAVARTTAYRPLRSGRRGRSHRLGGRGTARCDALGARPHGRRDERREPTCTP